ncbi:MAG: response regulator [Bacteriovoracaceae bacterium]
MDYGPRKLLVVEDDELVRETIVTLLKDENIDFVEAASGNQALKMLEQHQITAILSDINMPDGDGIMLLDELRKKGILCPFIFLTANESNKAMLAAIKNSVFEFIPKPFNVDFLIKVVFSALELGTKIQKASDLENGDKDQLKLLRQMQGYKSLNSKK